MSNPIPPKTHVDTSTQTSPAKKAEPKEKHPITDLATESLNIGSDSLDLNVDLNLDLSDLDIQILTPGDPNVSDINELSLEALNFDLPDSEDLSFGNNNEISLDALTSDLQEFSVITEGEIRVFIEDAADVKSISDQEKFAKDIQGFKLEAGFIVAVEISLAHVVYIKGTSSFVLPESEKNNFENNMAKYAEHLNIPLEKFNVIILSNEEWNYFISKVVSLNSFERNKVEMGENEGNESISKEGKRQHTSLNKESVKSNIEARGKSKVDDEFTKKMNLQEEANAMEILLQERKLERAKKSREKNQQIDDKELKREIDRKAVEKNEIKIQQEKKAHFLNKKI